MRNLVIALSILAGLLAGANVLYLRNTSSDEVKATCKQEKRDLFYENQFIGCLARQGR